MSVPMVSTDWGNVPPSELPEPIELSGDAPRARRKDPKSSHRGADKSARTRVPVSWAIAQMLTSPFDKATGVALNNYYRQNWKRLGWDRAAWDSPRKRAGEMTRRKQLAIVNPDSDDPAEYCLPENLARLTNEPDEWDAADAAHARRKEEW